MRNRIFVVGLFLTLSLIQACGGGSKGKTPNSNLPPPRPFGEITGFAVDAPISDATVTAYTFTAEGKGSRLAFTSTGSEGEFSLPLQAPSQIVLVEVTGGSYTEEATGTRIPLATQQRTITLRALVDYVSGEAISHHVTPYTNLVVGLVEHKLRSGTALAEALAEARTEINSLAGLDVSVTPPLAVTNDANAFTGLTDSARYGFLLASFSQLTANLTDDAGVNHASFGSIDFADVMYRDIAADGFLDGVTYDAEQLTILSTSVRTPLYRETLANAMMEFVESPANAMNLGLPDLLPYTQAINNNASQLFAGFAPAPLDTQPPAVVWQAPTELDGTVDLTVSAADMSGIKSVVYLLNGVVVGTASNTRAPSIRINSDNYPAGEHTITIQATDLLGNVSNTSFPVWFVPPAGKFSGVAHDGPIVNGTLEAFTFDGTPKKLLGTTVTDDKGDYELSVNSLDSPVFLRVSGGIYLEEASGRVISLADGQTLSAIDHFPQGLSIGVQLTHYTHWATCYARYLIDKEGENPHRAVTFANDEFGSLAGMPITRTKPVDITRAENFTAFITPGHSYGYLLAAISGVTAEIAALNNVQPHSTSQYTSIYFSDLVCRDIYEDGLMDGIGEKTEANPSGQLYMGSVPLSPIWYRTKVAEQILKIAANPQINKAGLTPPVLLEFANNFSTNINVRYGDEHLPRPVDLTGPNIAVGAGVAPGVLLAGEASIRFVVTDPIGVSSVTFYMDGEFLADGELTADGSVKADITTTNFADGEHRLRVVATDALDNMSEYTMPLRFVNSAPGITINSRTLVKDTRYIAEGTYASVGAPIDRIEVNGVTAARDTQLQTWAATITLREGVNTVTAQVFDTLGNMREVKMGVDVDLKEPEIKAENSYATFFNQGTPLLENCERGILSAGTNQERSICLATEKTALNGLPISAALAGEGFLLYSIKVNDPDEKNTGVFTPAAELIVEYQYTRNGSVMVNWAPLPRNSDDPSTIYLPVTTEYFGADFFKSHQSAEHTISLRVTDKAGNRFEFGSTKFKLSVFTPELTVLPARIVNPEIFSVDFSQRAGLMGAQAIAETEIKNETAFPYFIKLTHANSHSLQHTWDIAQRYHRVRERVTEEWQMKRISVVWGNPSPFQSATVMYRDYDSDYIRVYKIYNWEARSPHTMPEWIEERPQAPFLKAPVFVQLDTPGATPPTAWANRVPGMQFFNFHNHNIDFVTSTTAETDCILCGPKYYAGYVARPEPRTTLQQRSTFQWVSESGYPRNEFTQGGSTIPFSYGILSVLDNNRAAQSPVSGSWYLLPPNSSLYVRNRIALPDFTSHTDLRVVANDSSVPYTAISLDKTLRWTLSTGLTIDRSIAPTTGYSSEVIVEQQSTDGSTSFTLGR